MPIDAFFDSNDGFDDLILSAEANIPTTYSTTTRTTTSANSLQRSTAPVHHEAVLSEDLAAAFNDDNDDVFADFQWGSSGNQQQTNQRQIPTNISYTASTSNNVRGNEELDESFSAFFRDENDFNDDYVWGSAAKNARITQTSANNGPAAKKPKLQTTETRTHEEDYSWGSNSRIEMESEVNVKCSGCHQPAKE